MSGGESSLKAPGIGDSQDTRGIFKLCSNYRLSLGTSVALLFIQWNPQRTAPRYLAHSHSVSHSEFVKSTVVGGPYMTTCLQENAHSALFTPCVTKTWYVRLFNKPEAKYATNKCDHIKIFLNMMTQQPIGWQIKPLKKLRLSIWSMQ